MKKFGDAKKMNRRGELMEAIDKYYGEFKKRYIINHILNKIILKKRNKKE
jgi:hypothetical protein